MYLAPMGLVFTGPAGVEEYFQHSFQESPNARIAVQVTGLAMLKPDLAVGRGTYEVTGLVGPDGKPAAMKGPWVTTFFMKDGRWFPLAHTASMQMAAMK